MSQILDTVKKIDYLQSKIEDNPNDEISLLKQIRTLKDDLKIKISFLESDISYRLRELNLKK